MALKYTDYVIKEHLYKTEMQHPRFMGTYNNYRQSRRPTSAHLIKQFLRLRRQLSVSSLLY
jgi:hypothetical protein